MDKQTYSRWELLHQRTVLGEKLNEIEQIQYAAGCQELDAEEQLDGDLPRLREMRARIIEAEAEQRRLRESEKELVAQIAALEDRLDMRTRRLLGVGN